LIVLDSQWSRPPLEGLRRMVIVSWSSIGAYFLFISFVGHFSPSSLILLVILLSAWTRFLHKAVDVSTMADWRASDGG